MHTGEGKGDSVRSNPNKSRDLDNLNGNVVLSNRSGHGLNASNMLKNGDNLTNLMENPSPNSFGVGSSRILSLCQKGEWLNLEQLLRNTEKGSTDLFHGEEVSESS